MPRLLAFALLAAASAAHAADAAIMLDAAQRTRLAGAAVGSQFVLDGVPDGYGGHAALRFERVEVYAPGARVVRVDAAGEHELPRSRRVHWIGMDAAGSVRASLSFDAGFERLVGSGSSPAGAFVWSGERDGERLRLRAQPLASALPAGVVPQIVPGEDGIDSGQPFPDALSLALAGQVPSGSPRAAVVAIDTDNELMLRRFGNDTAAAADWIGDLFAAMNVMYLRDLNVSLQQGTTYLRVAPDPYTVVPASAADSAALNEFGNYWQDHYAGVPRSFAALLSGKSNSGNSASGIAWINAYCRPQSQGGSYSVNQVFANAQIPVAYSARIVGHELGHNFGAYHTHCTNVSTGVAPSATNTIDRCFSGAPGCYAGVTSCPSSGPGAPAGSIMSYCNLLGCGGGQNVLQFHPTQIATLSALIAQNTPSCLAASVEEIFSNGFD